MTKFNSVFVAALQYAVGFYIFKQPDLSGCGPLLSSMVVLFALSLVLWSLPLYPRKLRKLVWIGNGLAQYLIAVFFIEYIMGCFWFPLETAVLALLPKTAVTIEELLLAYEYQVSCEFLKMEGTGMFISYFLSFLILIAALHATRIVNLSLLSSGLSPFIGDVTRRMRRFGKKLPIILGLPKSRPTRSQKPEYCTSDDEGYEFNPRDQQNCSPSDSECQYTYR